MMCVSSFSMCQRPLDSCVSSRAPDQAIACDPWRCHLSTLSLHHVHCTIHVSSSEALFESAASEHDLEKYVLCHAKDVQCWSMHHLVNFLPTARCSSTCSLQFNASAILEWWRDSSNEQISPRSSDCNDDPFCVQMFWVPTGHAHHNNRGPVCDQKQGSSAMCRHAVCTSRTPALTTTL